MADEERRDRSTPIEDLYAEYTVYDMHYEKIGRSTTSSWTRTTNQSTSA